MRRLFPHWRDDLLAVWFALFAAYHVLVFALSGNWACDGLIYRAAGEAWLAGRDPWLAGLPGYNFAALPPVALLMAPAAFVPTAVYVPLSIAVGAAAGIFIVYRLQLPLAWLLFPPLVQGVLLANPAIPAFALLVAGWEPVALLVRPHLAFASLGGLRWRALALTALVGAVSLPAAPWSTFLAELPMILPRYGAQAGGPGAAASGLLYWVGIAAVLAMMLLDRRAAGWLGVVAIPSPVAYHGAVAAMPLHSRILGVILAPPLAGQTAVAAITALGLALWERRRQAERRPQAIVSNRATPAWKGNLPKHAGDTQTTALQATPISRTPVLETSFDVARAKSGASRTA